MEEKKSLKISLSTFFLFLAIMVIVIMAFYIYMQKTNYNEKIGSLKENNINMQNTINSLQSKIISMQNIINSNNTSSNNIATNDSVSEQNNTISLKKGNYTVNESKLDSAGVSTKDCGIEIKENNEFKLYIGYGNWHTGKYEIDNNILLCDSTLLEWENGGYGNRTTNVTFTFNIVNDNKLQLLEIVNNDSNVNNLSFEAAFSKGMTYSIK